MSVKLTGVLSWLPQQQQGWSGTKGGEECLLSPYSTHSTLDVILLKAPCTAHKKSNNSAELCDGHPTCPDLDKSTLRLA